MKKRQKWRGLKGWIYHRSKSGFEIKKKIDDNYGKEQVERNAGYSDLTNFQCRCCCRESCEEDCS